MIFFVVDYKLKAANAKAFVEAIERSGAADLVRAEDGCLRYEYYCPEEKPDEVILMETWESPEKQKLHMEQPHMATIQAIKEQFCDSVSFDNFRQGPYRHYKGNDYELLYVATHSETLEPMVVYQAKYGGQGVWVRPAYMWNETVEVNGESVNRFTYTGK